MNRDRRTSSNSAAGPEWANNPDHSTGPDSVTAPASDSTVDRETMVELVELIPQEEWNRFHWATPLLSLWKVWAGLGALVFSFLLQIAEQGMSEIFEAITGIGRTQVLMTAGVLLAISFLIVFFSWLIWRKARYVLAPSGIHLRSGVFSVTHRHVRWDRIQSVEIKQGIVPRIVGLGSIVIDSASGSGGDMSLGLLKMNQIQGLRSQILSIAASARAGQDFTVDDSTEPGEGLYDPDDVYEGERPFYVLPTGRLLGSLALSAVLIATVGSLATILIIMIVAGETLSIGVLVAMLGTLATMWGQFNLNHGLKLFLTADGIRVRRGLTTTTTQTIPPRRIHAVEISQPVLWRWKDWWKVEVLVAGAFGGDADDSITDLTKSVIMPVGSRKAALDLLWTIVPDIGVDDVRGFLEDAQVGTGASQHFVSAPASSKWLDPLARKRNGISLTRTVAVLRTGWLSRTFTVAFHGHWQGLKASQGPVQRRLKLATIRLSLVTGAVHWLGKNLALTDVTTLIAAERDLGLDARGKDDRESIEEWAERVGLTQPQ
ncbi:PH domain-containing protein [Flaviflexus massiliensis]|uniref:PH domain-containing protein n=1 Tax=Flaviflexus massiliensis TaxID=1522309 RepID=UPI0006D57632|nr:PH domain-containing protein [Flaviflexus massiliensis]